MNLRQRPLLFSLFACLVLLPYTLVAQDKAIDEQLKVALRMMGHQVLLQSGDSISRVLPISKEGNRYRIPMEGDFGFEPNAFVKTIDSVAQAARIANSYIFEVEACETGEIVYSFKVAPEKTADIIPCGGRFQAVGCYNLLFTLLEPGEALISQDGSSASTKGNLIFLLLAGFVLILASVLLLLFRNRNRKTAENPNIIQLGEYLFDKLNTELIIKEKRIELTSKEADLLMLLYDSANDTVERDVILNRVWGDEGDYVGRTLDVFISKLRKKLELDSKVKIVNIRGVGYKLVLNETIITESSIF